MHLQENFTFESKHFNIFCSLHLPILFVEKEHLYVIGSSCSWVVFYACFAKCNHCYSTFKKLDPAFQAIHQNWLGWVKKFLSSIDVDSIEAGLPSKYENHIPKILNVTCKPGMSKQARIWHEVGSHEYLSSCCRVSAVQNFRRKWQWRACWTK